MLPRAAPITLAVVCSALCLSSRGLWTLFSLFSHSKMSCLELMGSIWWDEKTENHGQQDRTKENLGAYILTVEEREDMASGLIRGGGPCWRRERTRCAWERHVGLGLGRTRLS